ncbi:MAG: filamentous hemagglutinin family protein, partial [Xanthobacteraceae bacterium]|nr:filamentous hemagglutinin family protein [Xanthobacteraceae bacterium]
LGNLTIGAGVILAGNTLTLDSSGTTSVPISAKLTARNYDLSGSIINLGGGAGGLVVSADLIANFAGADVVRLRSASVFNIYGSNTFGNGNNPIGTVILDGAGLFSDGGASSIAANNIVLTNSQATANINGANTGGAGGSLMLSASDTLAFGAGTKTLAGFAAVTGSAGREVLFTGTGSLDAKSASVSLAAPLFLVAGATSQAFTTTGALSLSQSGAAPALDPTVIGGSLALKGGSVDVTGTLAALGGTLTLEATTGNLNLSGSALLTAAGTRITIGDLIQDTPAGTVRLYADAGNVTLGAGTTVDVSGAGSGYAGSLSIFAGGTAALYGTVGGAARYSDLGGKFALVANRLATGLLFNAGFTRSFEVSLGQGDIVIGAGQALQSEKVLLVTNAGGIFIDGTIDASSASGGSIGLYGAGTSTAAAGTPGASGVTIGADARLYARSQAPDVNSPGYAKGESTLVQRGGTITLGTTGKPYLTAVNDSYGYENVPGSGAITVASGAIFDVSGGSGGANIDNTGGSVVIRAPILTNNSITNNSINVSFNGTVVTNARANGSASGDPLVVNAFAVWSTTDGYTNINKHFDGIIDPAGFFDATGAQLISATNGLYPASTPDAPATGAYVPHIEFYQDTLPKFVNNPFDTNKVAASVAGAKLQLGGNPAIAMPPSALHLRPEIDLVNPSTSINNGNITVASNWNFGAGSIDGTGQINLAYRTSNTREPGTLALRAVNDVKINATISDGFFTPYSAPANDANSAYLIESNSPINLAYEKMFGPTGLVFSGTALASLGFTVPPSTILDGSFFSSAVPGFEYYTSSDVFNSLQFHLQQPFVISGDPRVIDQYNQFYVQYAKMFDAYATEIVAVNTNAGTDPNIQATAGSGGYFSYANVVNAFANLLHVPPVMPVLAIPEAPSHTNPYLYQNLSAGTQPGANDYASRWQDYFFSVVDANLKNAGTGAGAGPGSLDALLNSAPRTLSNVAGVDAPFCVACFAVAPPSAPLAYTTVFEGTYAPAPRVAPPPPPPADLIANNPATYSVTNAGFTNTTSAVNLMTAAASGKGSFSYNFVGGARFNGDRTSSVNPDAVVQVSELTSSGLTGKVTIDGHTSYINPLNGLTVNVPTIVRTGTGSITIAAAGDFAMLDTVAPGTIYTAGYAADNAAGFTAPTLPSGTAANGLITAPVWATGGGNVIVTAGRDIAGIETPVDSGNQYSNDGSSQGVSTGEFWSAWYYVNGQSTGSATAPFDPSAGGVQYSTYINYGTFFQGLGALGGGNITLKAGRNVKDVSASLPETIQYSGGQSSSGLAATAHYYGGGNLLVEAGNDVLSGVYYVGRGTGTIRAGGNVVSDAMLYQTHASNSNLSISDSSGQKSKFSVPLLLAVQDGMIGVQAAGSIDLGGIFQPTQIPADLNRNLLPNSSGQVDAARTLPSAIGASFDTYGPNSGVSLTSQSGSIAINSLRQSSTTSYTDTLFTHGARPFGDYSGTGVANDVIAPSFSATALNGDINLVAYTGDFPIALYPSPNSALNLIAGGTIEGLNSAGTFVARIQLSSGNDTPVLIYAGEDIDNGLFTLSNPARVWAGRDIINLRFTGQNNAEDDITSIVANRDILARAVDSSSLSVTSLKLYGPGDFVIEAGRNLGPFFSRATSSGGGIMAIGDGSNSGSTLTPVIPSLPIQGANITVRYGVAKGIDYAAAISKYGDPTTAAASGIDFASAIVPQIEQIVDQLIIDRAKAAGIANPSVAVSLTPAQAAEVFNALSSVAINDKLTALAAKAGFASLTFNLRPAQFMNLLQQQDALKLEIDRGFLAVLKQVGLDYNNPASPYNGKYARAYEAIATLFPASLGYTDNSAGGTGAVPPLKHTGDLRMGRSLVETQTGGDINLLGPGGTAYVGSNSADALSPASQGILTLQGGSVRTYTDASVLIYQSRIFTEQGGNIELFSANGDLNAGKGPKSSAAYPPLRLICDVDGYCRVNPSGLVTGAGVGALLSVPGQDPKKSNVVLTAPHGVIDASAAGIRVAGDLHLAALQVLNAFNIQVGGATVGIPVVQGPPVAALTTAANTTAATQQAQLPAQS